MSLGKKTILILSLTKVISTVIWVTSYKLHDFFISFTAFTFPFSFAAFYDTELVSNYGRIMVIILLSLSIMWLMLFVFLSFKKVALVNISFVIFILVNCFDIICVVYSISRILTLAKIINLIFSILSIIVTALFIVKLNNSKQQN